ncbi:MAG: CHC2 zinc finger domain-containing protein [Hespellia sp.]|nr:CHC2 zinc finger domain-containing protein [Hespellia sp.]
MSYQLENYPFAITDVVQIMGIHVRRRHPENWDCDCPFCNHKKGKLNINTKKNVFRCNYCGEHGGMLALYGNYYNLTNREAYEEILSSLHLGTEAPQYKQPPKVAESEPEFQNSNLAPIEQISRTYHKLLSMLTLSEKHQEDLMKRGLTLTQIEEQKYRSTPVFGIPQLISRLKEGGYAIKGVPGFYQKKDGTWSIRFSSKASGILIPYFSVEGNLCGMQIRLDRPKDGQKYIWLSSVNQQMGVSSGSPVHFIGDPDAKVLHVTEGGLKGTIAHYLTGETYLCNAGVTQYKNLIPELKKLKQRHLQAVKEAYDMDKLMSVMVKPEVCGDCKDNLTCQTFANYRRCTPEVRKALYEMTCPRLEKKRDAIQKGCMHLYEICREQNISCQREVWDLGENGIWNGNIKGIDDYWYEQKRK